jgi:hypothetical protein
VPVSAPDKRILSVGFSEYIADDSSLDGASCANIGKNGLFFLW